MTINRKLALAGIITVLVAVVSWITVFNPDESGVSSQDDSLAWFESGEFEVGVATIPSTPRVGENELIVKVRLADGRPAPNVEVSAYAEMSAMTDRKSPAPLR